MSSIPRPQLVPAPAAVSREPRRLAARLEPFDSYWQAPKDVEVVIVESTEEPSGAGEMGIPGAAPALANAVYAATTVRVRKLPLMAQLMRML